MFPQHSVTLLASHCLVSFTVTLAGTRGLMLAWFLAVDHNCRVTRFVWVCISLMCVCEKLQSFLF